MGRRKVNITPICSLHLDQMRDATSLGTQNFTYRKDVQTNYKLPAAPVPMGIYTPPPQPQAVHQ